MKTVFYSLILTLHVICLQSQNVGINTTHPVSTLNVHDGTFGISGFINGTNILKLYDFQYVPGF